HTRSKRDWRSDVCSSDLFALGCGMGFCASPTVIAAQASVGWSKRGVVTGNNMFSRSIGSALGVAVFGAVVNGILGSATGRHTPRSEERRVGNGGQPATWR